MNQITVRQAVLADLESLVPLFDSYRRFYGRDSDLEAAREFLSARFKHEESVLFLATDAGAPVGFAQLYPSFSSLSLARTFILNDLFVTADKRRKGIGIQLLTAAVDYAKSTNAIQLSLATEITNDTAQALYQSAGWKQDEQFYVFHFTI